MKMKDESKKPYLYVPDYLHAREDLSAAERDVLGTIVALSKNEGYCYLNNKIFARVACVKTIRGAQYVLAKLKNKGLINVEIKRYKKIEIVEGKSKFGTVRKIYPVGSSLKQSKTEVIDKPHEESFMGGTQDSSHNIVNRGTNSNNYLESQRSDISYKENTTNFVPLSEASNEVIFRVMVKRTFNSILHDKIFLKELSIQKSELELAGEVFIYYVVKYKAVLGEEHPRYKQDQVKRCYLGFVEQVQILRNYGWSLEYVYWVFRELLNRWFLGTKKDKNILRLNSYFGSWENKTFFGCLKYVGLE